MPLPIAPKNEAADSAAVKGEEKFDQEVTTEQAAEADTPQPETALEQEPEIKEEPKKEDSAPESKNLQ